MVKKHGVFMFSSRCVLAKTVKKSTVQVDPQKWEVPNLPVVTCGESQERKPMLINIPKNNDPDDKKFPLVG